MGFWSTVLGDGSGLTRRERNHMAQENQKLADKKKQAKARQEVIKKRARWAREEAAKKQRKKRQESARKQRNNFREW